MELKIRDDVKFKPPAIMLVGGLVCVMCVAYLLFNCCVVLVGGHFREHRS